MPEELRDDESVELFSTQGERRTSGETHSGDGRTDLTGPDIEDFPDEDEDEHHMAVDRSHTGDTALIGGQFGGPQMNGGRTAMSSDPSRETGMKTDIEGNLCHKRMPIASLTMLGVADASKRSTEQSQHTQEASLAAMPKHSHEEYANGTNPSADMEPRGTYLASQVSEPLQQHVSELGKDANDQREDYSPQAGSHARTIIVRSRDCRQRPSD